ncbi:MAG: glycosyltransferase family 4 protein [Longimicrobiales bacterium]
MLRILHCIYDDRANPWVGGGGAARAHEIYRRLTDRVSVLVVTGNYPGAREETIAGVSYLRVGAPRPYVLSRASYARAAAKLIRGARSGGYDAAVLDFSVYAPVRVPHGMPVGLVVHHLTGVTAAERWGRILGGGLAALERRLIRRARWISTPSQWTLARVRSIASAGTGLFMVGAGVDDSFFEVRRRPQGYLLYFGRLDVFQKGLDTLLAALARVREARAGIELKVAGRGRDADRLREMVGRLGLTNAVRLLGPVSDRERTELLAGAEILVMPSRFEGFGLVAAEALAAGVPVVASHAGALAEVVPPDVGVLVEPGDVAGLATVLTSLLADEGRRRALSERARASAGRFRWAVVAERHYEFLEAIAGGDSPG